MKSNNRQPCRAHQRRSHLCRWRLRRWQLPRSRGRPLDTGRVDLFIDAAGGRGLSEQLYEQIRAAIAAGRLRPGDQLLPSRDAARQLGISRHTVTTAYGRLVAEGFVSGRAGGGSFVAGLPVPEPDPGSGPGSRAGPAPAAVRPARRFTGWTPAAGPLQPAEVRYNLRAGLADPRLFPADAWHKRDKTAVRPGGRPAATGDPAGEPGLRLAIARWIGRSRAVAAEADTVVVTSGAQHAVDLVARVLLEPGATVAVEDPGYLPVVRLLRSLGARHDAAIIEDDYDSEFRHVDRPLEPLHRLDDSGRVVYVGSFSKVLSPELRIGFAVAPPSLAGPVTALRQLIDWHPPVMAQAALTGLLEDGTIDRHLRRAGPGRSTPHATRSRAPPPPGRRARGSASCRPRPACTSPPCCPRRATRRRS